MPGINSSHRRMVPIATQTLRATLNSVYRGDDDRDTSRPWRYPPPGLAAGYIPRTPVAGVPMSARPPIRLPVQWPSHVKSGALRLNRLQREINGKFLKPKIKMPSNTAVYLVRSQLTMGDSRDRSGGILRSLTVRRQALEA